MIRKYFSILAVIVVIVGLLVLGYYLRSPKSEEVENDGSSLPLIEVSFDPQKPSIANATGTAVKSLSQALEAPVFAYGFNASGSLISVFPSGSVEVEGQGLISETDLPGIFAAKISPDGAYVAVGYNNRSNPIWSVLSIKNKSWEPLSGSILDASWSPEGNKLALATNTGIQSIDFSAPKPKASALMNIALADALISWPLANQIVISDMPTARSESSILLLDIKKRVLSSAGSGRGYYAIWNTDVSRGLAFKSMENERGGILSEIDRSGNSEKDLSISTLPEKCAFYRQPDTNTTSTNEYLACAVPANVELFASQQLPDSYLKRSFFTQDNFMKIDTKNGDIRYLLVNGGPFDATDIQIKNNRLYFKNRLDSKIYSISL